MIEEQEQQEAMQIAGPETEGMPSKFRADVVREVSRGFDRFCARHGIRRQNIARFIEEVIPDGTAMRQAKGHSGHYRIRPGAVQTQ